MIFIIAIYCFILQTIAGKSTAIGSLRGPDCSLNLSHLNIAPIVVDKDYQYLYAEPDVNDILVSSGDTIIVSCPGGILSTIEQTTISAKCESGIFYTNETTLNINDINCSKKPHHTAHYTGDSCEENGDVVEIGFQLSEDIFIKQISVCFDSIKLNAIYSTANITRSIGHHEIETSRPGFVQDSFYTSLNNTNVNNLYERDGQQATINSLLGLPHNSTKFIQDSGNIYLARGHLTPMSDFVYNAQQSATFHYVNAAPQWQTFNDGNWKIIEDNVRDYAEGNEIDLLVYSGTYGITTLPHEKTGKAIPLYLYAEDFEAIPIPELFWKVIYDFKSKKGIAVLGINNPYEENVEKSIICKDISSAVNWLSFKTDNLKSGYSYACTVEDFRRKVQYLPEFQVIGVLA